jgi:Ca2+-transporting ATPase
VQVPLDEKSRKANLASLHELSTKALCCLGFAYKEDLGEFGAFDGDSILLMSRSLICI